ncbi:MAG: glycoside hydrolase family 2 TIM barrel-domain containing protein [Xanthobacter sp.]
MSIPRSRLAPVLLISSLFRTRRICAMAALCTLLMPAALHAAPPDTLPAMPALQKPKAVRDEVTVDGTHILVNGRPFLANGAGGRASFEDLARLGATTVRTYGQDPGPVLDAAEKAGLKVIAGLWLEHPRHGFDYRDAQARKAQLEKLRPMVERYRNHPALLMWGVGNEIEVAVSDEAARPVWPAIEEAAQFVKALDPHHPVMAVTADTGADKVAQLVRHAPSVDVLGLNAYGDSLLTITERARAQGWKGPIIFTEMGADGHWSVPRAPWGAPIEPNTTAKADKMRHYLQLAKQQGIGAIPIVWGDKQEVTPTWYSLLLPTGEWTETVGVMAELWGGTPPGGPNRAPRIEGLNFEGPMSFPPDGETRLKLTASDPDGDPLDVTWQVMAETTAHSVGGAPEPVPPSFPQAVHEPTADSVRIAGLPPGQYRIFATVRDGKGAGASINLPFEVK